MTLPCEQNLEERRERNLKKYYSREEFQNRVDTTFNEPLLDSDDVNAVLARAHAYHFLKDDDAIREKVELDSQELYGLPIGEVVILRGKFKGVLDVAIPIRLEEKPLGKGGYSEVYKAKNLLSGEDYSLSFDLAEADADPPPFTQGARQRLNSRTLNGFNFSERVVTSWGRGKVEAALNGGKIREYNVECRSFVPGKSLFDVLNDPELCNELTFEQKLQIMLDILEGLKELHEKGILHKDIKTENIFITPEFRAVIGDLGIASTLVDYEEELATSTLTK